MARLSTVADDPRTEHASILDAAQQWKQKCLLSDGSIFTTSDLWTKGNLSTLDKCFSQNPISGDEAFLDKFRQQLQSTNGAVKQLAAELLWLLSLFPTNISGQKKRENIITVWSWSGNNLDPSHPLLAVLDHGIGHAGPGFNQHRDRELSFAIKMTQEWKQQSPRLEIIEDPWKFGDWLDGIPGAHNRQLRHMIVFLLFPDYYERISARRHKKAIATQFNSLCDKSIATEGDSPDVVLDKGILSIRRALEKKYPDQEIDFYRPPVEKMWRKPEHGADGEPEPGAEDNVKLPSQSEAGRKRYWLFQANPQFYDLPGALRQLGEQTWRVSGYRSQIHVGDGVFMWESGPEAGILGIATVACEPKEMGLVDPEKPFVRNEAEFAQVEPRVILTINKVLTPRLSKLEILRDDVLSKLSIIANPRGTNFPVTPDQVARLRQILGLSEEDGFAHTPSTITDDQRFKAICERTFLPATLFRDLERLLNTKGQVILQGAPGTGKTFVAEAFAHWWTEDPARVRVLQFHESYGYEDFVWGFKPASDDTGGETRFVLTPGPFVDVCELASKSINRRVVLLIDEINRAKTSRVFGELLYLLEYRNKSIVLQSGKSFSIPDNLHIIGTMNTVDKSIALVDFALRRRFAFVTLFPLIGGKSVVLRAWLDRNGVSNADEVEKLFVALNKLIADKDESLMIGHSYFMSDNIRDRKQATDDELQFIWRYYILPLVAEYEYEMTAQQIEEKYGLAAIRRIAV